MIVDCIDDVLGTLTYIQGRKTLLVPIFCSPSLHVTVNSLCAIYIYTEDDIERLIPIRHTEQLRGFPEHVSAFLESENIFVHDKKQWLQIGGNGSVLDVKTLWWYTYNEAYDEGHYPTAAHQFYWRRHQGLAQVNSIVPLQQHLAMCQKIRHYAWPMCMNAEQTDSYLQFNATYPQVFATIEHVGLQVDETFRMPELVKDNKVYSQYNYYTMTGRPSNAYRGFNFAAMNKEDGTRAAFCSESKQITFRLLYGGIDSEFLSIPFFQRVNAFVYELWAKWKAKGRIETPILKRPITKDMVKNMTANKLFNYYLQATETEVSVQKLQQVQNILKERETVMILYTYDSVLFDVPVTEAKELLPQIKKVLEQGNFPTKVKVGNIYDKIKTISL